MKTRLQNQEICRAGFTLVEMLVTLAIGSLVLMVIGLLMVFTTRSFIALGNYNDLDQASRNALDVISRDIRQTKALKSFTSTATYAQLVFRDKDDGDLEYVWNSNGRTLVRIKNTRKTILLDQCDALRFGISQRNPSNNFNFYPASGPATAKLVDISWTCSRKIQQQKVNTESVQTAKIVIRN
jgi:prepilin-type N-terminal cleavage/methylation domain-containing protein